MKRSMATAAAIVLIIAGLAAGCTAIPAAAPHAGLTIEGPFARPAPGSGQGGAFLTVVNAGSNADRLIAARSPVAPVTELHETIDDNGVMKMRPVPGGFEVPAGGRLELKPGGKHLMFVGLTTPLTAGGEIEITLVFEKAGEIAVKAPVQQ